MFSTQPSPEKAILVAVKNDYVRQDRTAEDSLAELSALVQSAGGEVVGKLVQRARRPFPATYVGKGKLEELRALKDKYGYDTVIVDDELEPKQQENLEDFLESKVIDRVSLILAIFARRARTHEGKLQVELAQYEYNLPRLNGKWSHLERLGGGIGTRGPGESQLETDKRIMRQKIGRLKTQIDDVRKQRELYRQRRRRSGIPVVALVGYTNTGKSTLLNSLSRANVLAKNELFSTLDPTTRRLVLADGRTILLTDTVGFIRKLPTNLIAAFRATLEEIEEADLLIHVVDLTLHNAADQCDTVEDILNQIGLGDKPRITALNKIDQLAGGREDWDVETGLPAATAQQLSPSPDSVLISASKGWGLDKLRIMIGEKLGKVQASQVIAP
jgi:GTP-binding protein HflX